MTYREECQRVARELPPPDGSQLMSLPSFAIVERLSIRHGMGEFGWDEVMKDITVCFWSLHGGGTE